MLLAHTCSTFCDGLLRQRRREGALTSLARLVNADVEAEDSFPPPLSDEEEEGSVTTWEGAAELVGAIYGGFEEQARDMSVTELLLDVLRMAQLQVSPGHSLQSRCSPAPSTR